jgi:RNAse (barnase) inhibitor barstar
MQIDLQDVTDKTSLFKRFDEILIVQNWGHNWDALNDCLRDLNEGGFTKKYEFPLTLEFKNWEIFSHNSPDDFRIFKDILSRQVFEHKNCGEELTIFFL